MKEIGGYLEFDNLISNTYYTGMKELNSARYALIYLIKSKKIRKLYLPNFLCDSVSGALDRFGVSYETYKVNSAFQPEFKKALREKEYVYVVNYYGQLSNDYLETVVHKFGNVIVDNTHSFFQSPLEGVDTIYSLRKFFGIPDGAYLFTECELNTNLDNEKVLNRLGHIFGRYEENATDYYSDFKKNDETFKTSGLKGISKISRNLLGALDYEKIRETRSENFEYLHKHLEAHNSLNISIPNGPFSYPFYSKNGPEIRKRLAEKKIYISTLWPNVIEENAINSIEYDYAKNILPIPCDQRYSIEDMERIIKELEECIN